MEYTSEFAVIKDNGRNYKNPFNASAALGFKSIINSNIKSGRFWLPTAFYALIMSLFYSIVWMFTDPSSMSNQEIATNLRNMNYFSITIFFGMMVIIMTLTLPWVFKKTNQKNIIEKMGARSYWGLIVGKFTSVVILFTIYSFIGALINFTLLSAFFHQAILNHVTTSLIILFGGILTSLTWVLIITSWNVMFTHSWQGSTFTISFMLIMALFLPLQAYTTNKVETVEIVAVDTTNQQNGISNVTKQETVTNYSNKDLEESIYKYIAPIDMFAATRNNFGLTRINFKGDEYSNFEKDDLYYLLSNPTNKEVNEVFYNPVNYEDLYTTSIQNESAAFMWEITSKSSDFGMESEIVDPFDNNPMDTYITDALTYKTAEEIIQKYNSGIEKISNGTVEYGVNKDVDFVIQVWMNAFASTTLWASTTWFSQGAIDNPNYTTFGSMYIDYVNDDYNLYNASAEQRYGSYSFTDENPSLTPEMISGEYKTLDSFTTSISTHTKINNQIVDYEGEEIKIDSFSMLESFQRENKILIAKQLGETITSIKDWNYINSVTIYLANSYEETFDFKYKDIEITDTNINELFNHFATIWTGSYNHTSEIGNIEDGSELAQYDGYSYVSVMKIIEDNNWSTDLMNAVEQQRSEFTQNNIEKSLIRDDAYSIPGTPIVTEQEAAMRADASAVNSTGTYNRTYYSVEESAFIPAWAYFLGMFLLAALMTSVSSIVVIKRNYY